LKNVTEWKSKPYYFDIQALAQVYFFDELCSYIHCRWQECFGEVILKLEPLLRQMTTGQGLIDFSANFIVTQLT
jgi:hypothetical protein